MALALAFGEVAQVVPVILIYLPFPSLRAFVGLFQPQGAVRYAQPTLCGRESYTVAPGCQEPGRRFLAVQRGHSDARDKKGRRKKRKIGSSVDVTGWTR